jgi:hypothetical protein
MTSSFVIVKDLPASLQAALDQVGYGRKDVEVTISTTVVLASPAYGDGYRGYTTLVNVDSGETQTVNGQWGGSNMFVSSPVDEDETPYQLPDFGAVIKGQVGGGRPVSAHVYIPAAQAPKVLPSGLEEPLPALEREALAIFQNYKAAYRKDYLRRAGVHDGMIDDLIERGLLSRNRAGATSITTAGKNAVGNHH